MGSRFRSVVAILGAAAVGFVAALLAAPRTSSTPDPQAPASPTSACAEVEKQFAAERSRPVSPAPSCDADVKAAEEACERRHPPRDCTAEVKAATAAARPRCPAPRSCRSEVKAAVAAAEQKCAALEVRGSCASEVETAVLATQQQCKPATRDCTTDVEAALAEARKQCIPPAAVAASAPEPTLVADTRALPPEPRDCHPEVDAAVSAALARASQSQAPPRDCRAEVDSAVRAARRSGRVDLSCAATRSRLSTVEGCVQRVGDLAATCLSEKVPFPPRLDPAFVQPELGRRFTRAFTETGIAGAVRNVDCSEYPCIVEGHIDADLPLTTLLAAPALQVYEVARRRYAFAKSEAEVDGKTRRGRQFTIALYATPPTPDDEATIVSRLPLRTMTARQ